MVKHCQLMMFNNYSSFYFTNQFILINTQCFMDQEFPGDPQHFN